MFNLDCIKISERIHVIIYPNITVMSQWVQWHLKSSASWLFTQLFIQGADQKECQSSGPLAFVRGIHRWQVNSPAQRASNAEIVFIWWRPHEFRVAVVAIMQ